MYHIIFNFCFAILYQTGADRCASCSGGGGSLARMLRNEEGVSTGT